MCLPLITGFCRGLCSPWCFIGERRLVKALNTLDSKQYDVKVTVLPYLLEADLPSPGIPRKQMLMKKYNMTEEKYNESVCAVLCCVRGLW